MSFSLGNLVIFGLSFAVPIVGVSDVKVDVEGGLYVYNKDVERPKSRISSSEYKLNKLFMKS